MKHAYETSKSGHILYANKDAIAVRKEEFPAQEWLVTSLMNTAYNRGYEQAMADIRNLIGVK